MSRRKSSTKKRMQRYKEKCFRQGVVVRCRYCNKVLTPFTATVDHLISLYDGGEDDESNYGIACKKCNNDKGELSEQEYLEIKKDFKNRNQYFQEKAMEEARHKDSPFIDINEILGGEM